MKIASIISSSAALLGFALSLNAGAHALWLESGTAGSKLYFGEYAENLRETSPGRLDSIVEPEATVIDQAGAKKRSAQAVKILTFPYRQARQYLSRRAASRYVHRKGRFRRQFKDAFFMRAWVTEEIYPLI